MPSKSRAFRVGDVVGIAIPRYRKGELIGQRIAVTGMITKIYRFSPKQRWRADINWDDPQKGWLYTGKEGWEYTRALTLVEAAVPIKEEKRGYTIRYPRH
jgi:hypothetical protein